MAFPSGSHLTASYVTEVMKGSHNHTASTGNTFKLGLLTDSTTVTATSFTNAASLNNEVATANGYTAGGKTLTNITPLTTSLTGYTSWTGPDAGSACVWTATGAGFTARGAYIINDTSNLSVGLYNFGSDLTASGGGTFTVSFPTNDSSTATVRITAA